MIVELPGSVLEYQFGTAKRYRMGFFHFSNNNLSIRRDCARDLGMYDPRATKSEDVEICFRVAQDPRWIALRERGNIISHKARRSLMEMIKQLWGWGYYSAYPYAKTGLRGVHLYWLSSSTHTIRRSLETSRFPILVCMFLSAFHAAHLLLLLALIMLIVGQGWLSLAAAALSLPCVWSYLHDDRLAGRGLWQVSKLALVHYIANVVFSIATILGGLRHGILLVPSSIFRPGPPGRG